MTFPAARSSSSIPRGFRHLLLLSGIACLAVVGCNGSSIESTLSEAESRLQQHEADAAIRMCNKALQTQSDSAKALRLRAQAFLQRNKRGDSKRAVDDLTLVLEFNEDDQDALYHRGVANMKRQAHSAAIEDFSALLKRSPRNLEALLNRAEAHLLLAEHELAVADCNAALAVDKDSASAYVLRGRANLANDDAAAAESDLSTALSTDNRCAAAYWYRAMARASQGRDEDAQQDRDRAADLDRRFAAMNSRFREKLVEGLDQKANSSLISPLKVDIDR